MEGMEDKLSKILSNPEAMDTILKLSKSLGGNAASAPEPEDSSLPEAVPAGLGGLGGLMGALSGESGAGLMGLLEGVEPDLLLRLMGALGELGRTDDRRALLLRSLSGYVRPERAAKLERAQQYLRIARVAGQMLGGGP